MREALSYLTSLFWEQKSGANFEHGLDGNLMVDLLGIFSFVGVEMGIINCVMVIKKRNHLGFGMKQKIQVENKKSITLQDYESC